MPRYRIEAPAYLCCYCEVEAESFEEAIKSVDTAEWKLPESVNDFDVGDAYLIEDLDTEEQHEVCGDKVMRNEEEEEVDERVQDQSD